MYPSSFHQHIIFYFPYNLIINKLKENFIKCCDNMNYETFCKDLLNLTKEQITKNELLKLLKKIFK